MNWVFYLDVLEKMIVAIVMLLGYNRLSGLRRLAPMTTFDSIGNMIIGAVAGTTLLNEKIHALDIVIFMVIWLGVMLIIRYIKGLSPAMRHAIDGSPIYLIKDGEMVVANYSKINVSNKGLQSRLRSKGVKALSELDELIAEPNGQLSYTKKDSKDFGIILVDKGQPYKYGLQLAGYTEQTLNAELTERGYGKIEDLFCVEYNSDGKLWVQEYGDSARP